MFGNDTSTKTPKYADQKEKKNRTKIVGFFPSFLLFISVPLRIKVKCKKGRQQQFHCLNFKYITYFVVVCRSFCMRYQLPVNGNWMLWLHAIQLVWVWKIDDDCSSYFFSIFFSFYAHRSFFFWCNLMFRIKWINVDFRCNRTRILRTQTTSPQAITLEMAYFIQIEFIFHLHKSIWNRMWISVLLDFKMNIWFLFSLQFNLNKLKFTLSLFVFFFALIVLVALIAMLNILWFCSP